MKKIIIGVVTLVIIIGTCLGTYLYLTKDAKPEKTTDSTGEIVELREPSKEYDEEAVYNEDNQMVIIPREEVSEDGSRKFIKTIRFDVPLEEQMAEPALENGSGVTALSMLLNYYRIGTSKNELAAKLPVVPYEAEDGIHGDPTKAFVGNIESGKALGVYADPLAVVAQEIVGDSYQVVSSSQTPFEEVLEQVQKNRPVWIATSENLQIPKNKDYQTWETETSILTVPKKIHAVVIVGMDQYRVYVNDPLGEKEKELKIGELKEIYERTGSQSLYLRKR
ncbi:C39 family peptidase [Candidatus Enterococcus willemsii]|nr:C39 family peptidase [Enterococcus sp. CU12B]